MTRIELTIDGQRMEFAFGLGYLGELLDETNKSLDEIVEAMNRNPFKTVPLMMHISAKYARESKNLEYEHTFNDFLEMLENEGGINSNFSERFLTHFKNSINGKNVPKDESGGGDAQKKR